MAGRKNNRTVHFMVNDEIMEELEDRFIRSGYKTRREFYKDSILKNKIVSIDLEGKFKQELREISSLVSRNAANINQIVKLANSVASIKKDDVELIHRAVLKELEFIAAFREKVMNHIYNEVVH